ncbi:threonine--tRNA ligase [Candidatus Nitrosocosmicus sp. SS]|jgi:threonyl-tRNA synthetase|uniref:threonine--tRNA ligase n=1 Tax=Candidatus Nitrosocosmicus agrestis TaxID=2563600 RepID=UPI00122E2D59|nr:threonine--tRNA ligase [Candidatus Nitrosocosmicus sp. SS]KAA2279136.1 threonine--tRNA ligase [Candidatus Nitrosocosmicus sp. SS]KAF0867680.1 threonine--tRNA ligase [Candidatus Nitrosocosmicus sp. SS]
MRILQLHVDYIEYTPIKEEIVDAEPIVDKEKKRLENIVVILLSVEKGDENLIIEDFLNETKKYLDTIKCNSLLLYPYAHLSANLEKPKKAMQILDRIEKELKINLKDSTYRIYRAPFGWTKQLEFRVKGHPMAENSKTFDNVSKSEPSIGNEKLVSLDGRQDDHDHAGVSQALSAEKTLKSSWFILEPNGLLTRYEDYNFRKTENNLKNLFKYEILKNRTVEEQPPHVKLMRKLGIADYEPASDSGNMRYYPKGRLLKSLLEQFVSRKVSEYGGLEVETPIMYDSHHPSMESYFNRFPARQYNIKSDQKELFLRFAACFGQFLMTKDFQISYKNLPLKLYELTRYSFRREKSGELVGLRRLRAFSMPDCHAFCRDLEQAKSEFEKRFDLSISVLEEIGLDMDQDIEMAIRFTKEFYENNKQFVNSLVSKIGKPVMMEMWSDRFFYFTLKWEFNFLDNQGKASSLSTDQIDIENAERYDISFIDEDGTKKYPIILHNSPSGAIERIIFALLEKSARLIKEGKTPFLPLWLMNTQVRIIPIKNELIPFCEKIRNELKDNLIRCDLDDRDDSLSKKIREAETEWIHYIIIVGEKEVESDRISVRDRIKKENYTIDNNAFIQLIRSQIKGKPYLPINLQENLSKRPRIAS